jgi:prepilin-type processing-associated H-X9-DG protein
VIVSVLITVCIVAILLKPPIACGCISKQGVSTSNIAQIAKTYAAYTQSSKDGRILTAKPGDTAHDAALILARYASLNDASFWFIWSDSALAGKPHPHSVLVDAQGNNASVHEENGTLNPDFARLQLSYVFAANIPLNAAVETTPLVWTRGLQFDGTWAKDSPWKGDGGHVAFLDGHVEWYEKLPLTKTGTDGPDPLVKYGTTTPTTDIREALPPGAIILPAEPAKTP